MRNLLLADRAASDAQACPDVPTPRTDSRWLDGMGVLGHHDWASGPDAQGRAVDGAMLHEGHRELAPGGPLVWFETPRPMRRNDCWSRWGLIGALRSTNHRVRLDSCVRRSPAASQTRFVPGLGLMDVCAGDGAEEGGPGIYSGSGRSDSSSPSRLTDQETET